MQCPAYVEYAGLLWKTENILPQSQLIHCSALGCLSTRLGNHRFREFVSFTQQASSGLGKFGTSECKSSDSAKEKELESYPQLRDQIEAG